MPSTKHRRRLLGAAAAAATTVATAGFAIPAHAASSSTTNAAAPGASTAAKFQRLSAAQLAQAKDNAQHWLPASLSNKPVTVMLDFGGAPVAVQDAQAKKHGKGLSQSQKSAIRSQLKQQQSKAAGAIAAKGGTIVAQLADAYNGVIVHAKQRDLPALAQVSGVVGVRPLATFTPLNVNGVPYVGGPQTWATGLTGAGVKIADIDTGIDYFHADFGGPGSAADFADNDGTTLADGDFATITHGKVAKGYDFVGDDYNADSTDPAQAIPHPDPDPLDCNGHGTHTAGTVAGEGVLADGSTFTGPYTADTVSSNSWKVGPGVAPEATIYDYRVFGCAGSSNVVAAAIDRAVADGADVITMSLGSTFGDPTDPTAVASQNAVDDGVMVVAAAGNDGPSPYMVGSPAAANGVLAVAAIDGSLPAYPGADIALPDGNSVQAIDANGATFADGTTLPVKVLKNADGTIALGCDPADYQDVTGKLVVTMRGTCARVARAIYGQQAGAAAVVMVNTDDSLPPYEGPIDSNPDTGEPYHVTIPFFGVPNSAGDALLAADGGDATLNATSVPNPGYASMASFSSGGPRNLDSALKPEIAAPGVSVASAGMGTGTGFLVDSGTSMATPMTAGSAALVVQAHPDWTPAQVKAALMETADDTTAKLNGYNVRLAGAGVVQADKAVAATVLATTADGLDSLSFGLDQLTGAWSGTRTVTLTNTGASAATYALSVQTTGSQLGADVSVSPQSVTVPAGGTATVTATLSLSADAVAALPSSDTFAGVGPGALASIRGDIVATPADGTAANALHVPYLAVPKALADVQAKVGRMAKTDATPRKDVFTGTVSLKNAGAHQAFPTLYAWGIHDAQDGTNTMDVRDAGVQVLPGSAAGAPDSDRLLQFVVNNYVPTTVQAENEFDIALDTNGDGNVDAYVVEADLGDVLSGAFNGVPASFTIDADGNVVDAWYADSAYNGATVELPAVASELGITADAPAFAYTVTGFSMITGASDSTGTATFDAFSPAVSSGDTTTLDPGATGSLPVTVDRSAFNHQRELGWLVVDQDDAGGPAQADELALTNASIRG